MEPGSHFQPVLTDSQVKSEMIYPSFSLLIAMHWLKLTTDAEKVILCSGKISYALRKEREERSANTTAIISIEVFVYYFCQKAAHTERKRKRQKEKEKERVKRPNLPQLPGFYFHKLINGSDIKLDSLFLYLFVLIGIESISIHQNREYSEPTPQCWSCLGSRWTTKCRSLLLYWTTHAQNFEKERAKPGNSCPFSLLSRDDSHSQ